MTAGNHMLKVSNKNIKRSTEFLQNSRFVSQPTITKSKLTTETLEQGVKYVQNQQ